MLFILGVLLGLLTTSVLGNEETQALELVEKAQHLTTLYAQQAADLNAKTCSINATCVNPQLDAIIEDPQKGLNSKFGQEHKFMIFISSSMPESSLQALYKQACSQQVPLILRGLKNNSFKETAAFMQNLKIAVQIDPQLFVQYQVSAVPTFVHLTEGGFDSLSGNVSFEFAKMKLLEKIDE